MAFSVTCGCDKSEERFAWIFFAVIVAVVVYGLMNFRYVVRETKLWLEKKQALRSSVKLLSRQANQYRKQNGLTMVQDEYGKNLISDYIKNINFGGDKKQHLFVMDYKGKILYHGKSPQLSDSDVNLTQMDDHRTGYTPVLDMIRVAMQGGGYVYFQWKKKNMIAYAYPIQDTDLLLVGVLPLPSGREPVPNTLNLTGNKNNNTNNTNTSTNANANINFISDPNDHGLIDTGKMQNKISSVFPRFINPTANSDVNTEDNSTILSNFLTDPNQNSNSNVIVDSNGNLNGNANINANQYAYMGNIGNQITNGRNLYGQVQKSSLNSSPFFILNDPNFTQNVEEDIAYDIEQSRLPIGPVYRYTKSNTLP